MTDELYEITFTNINKIRNEIMDLNLDFEKKTSKTSFLMRTYAEHFHGNKKVCIVIHKPTQKIVGWSYAFFQFSYFEMGCYLLPDHRGYGLGKRMVLECIKNGLRRNITRKFYFNTHSKEAEKLYFSAFREYDNEIVSCDNEQWYMVRVKNWDYYKQNATIAQLAEQDTCSVLVGSSSLSGGFSGP